MYVTPIKGFPHLVLGYLAKGSIVEVTDDEGARLVRLGHVNPAAAPLYSTKVVRPSPVTGEVPGLAGGAEQQSSASPAAQASQQTTSNVSESGDGLSKKDRRRIKKFLAGSS